MGKEDILHVNFGLEGPDRKRLVDAICRMENAAARYLGTPAFAYKAGRCTVDREGRVTFDEGVTMEEVETLLQGLAEQGFVPKKAQAQEPIPEALGLTVTLPLDGFSESALGNLRKIIDAKAALITKALSADRLTVGAEDGKLIFPWWDALPSPEETDAYIAFLAALCKLAKDAKRVNASERETESEKYAFRCFLVRLGFVGPECKAQRKELLKRLSGSAAFPNGEKAAAFGAVQKAKRDAVKAKAAAGEVQA